MSMYENCVCDVGQRTNTASLGYIAVMTNHVQNLVQLDLNVEGQLHRLKFRKCVPDAWKTPKINEINDQIRWSLDNLWSWHNVG